jgi:probable rRNA maturation factor
MSTKEGSRGGERRQTSGARAGAAVREPAPHASVTFRGYHAVPALRHFALHLQRQVTKGRIFDCLIADDAELRRLNREFRKKDYATDVLSFPADAGNYIGDIAISVDRARAQAREFGHAIHIELRILMLHGVLHLLGYDHETDDGRMARAEKRWRAKFGLPVGLIERVSR